MALTDNQLAALVHKIDQITAALTGTSIVVGENLAQVNGVTVDVGTGTAGLGTQRVAVANNSTIITKGDVADNAAQVNLNPSYVGAKAVDSTTYAPAYTAGDAAGLANDTINGGLLVNQGNLQEDQDIVTSYLKCTSTSAGTPSAYRLQGSINTATAVKASAGNLYGWNIRNNTGAAVYVKFYDTAQASVVVGTTAVVLSLQVPANGSIYQESSCVQHNFATAISVASVTGWLDNDATSPGANAVTLELKYK